MIHGDGPVTTMAAGLIIHIMAGCGYPVTNGPRHGLAGAMAVVIADGRL